MKKTMLFLCFIGTLGARTLKQPNLPETTLFTIIIPSYNNELWLERNLNSVFSQNYQNFNVIYINDNSEDRTFELVTNYVKKNKLESKTTLISNKARMGQLANRYRAAHLCDDDAVLVMLDGDDWLAHDNVLNTLNTVYTKNQTWLTYGQYQRWCNHCQENPLRATTLCTHIHGKGWSAQIPNRIISKNSIRTYKWVTSHLRTFKAWLFKQIPLCQLHHQGRLFDVGTDISTMIPMIEMAGNHTQFIDQILYIYNRDNPASCWKPGAPKIMQTNTTGILRKGKKNMPLKEKIASLSWNDYDPEISYINLANTPQSKNSIKNISQDFKSHTNDSDYVLILKERCSLSKKELIPYLEKLEQTKSRAAILDQEPRVANEIIPHGLCAPLKVGTPKRPLSKYNNVLIRSSDLGETTSIEKTLRNFIQANDTVIY